VSAGYAWHYVTYAKKNQNRDDYQAYEAAQIQAKSQKLGLWALANPTPPWQYRREQKNSPAQSEK
jgi:endonuclease YncB( thermonuclease family)